jgi:hypothetical protein
VNGGSLAANTQSWPNIILSYWRSDEAKFSKPVKASKPVAILGKRWNFTFFEDIFIGEIVTLNAGFWI